VENFNQDIPVDLETTEVIRDAVASVADLLGPGVPLAEFDPLVVDETTEGRNNLDLLLDVRMPISVEVGRTKMSLTDILDLVPGSVIPLDKKAEEPVDLRVNGKLIAHGEVVLVDDVYGVRITQIVDSLENPA
jgi:flagellar motor switch protein FliN